MGASRRMRPGPRTVRALAVAALAVVAGGALAACDPAGLSSVTVAYTTDTTATAELKRQHVDVNWLTCTGHYGGRASGAPSPTESAVVSVDCRGRTKDNRAITVTGAVTRAVNGACVRGNLTAEVGGRRVFHVSGLGDCDATPTYRPPTYRPPVTVRPPGGRPTVTVTVTVTRTERCDSGPGCGPVAGK